MPISVTGDADISLKRSRLPSPHASDWLNIIPSHAFGHLQYWEFSVFTVRVVPKLVKGGCSVPTCQVVATKWAVVVIGITFKASFDTPFFPFPAAHLLLSHPGTSYLYSFPEPGVVINNVFFPNWRSQTAKLWVSMLFPLSSAGLRRRLQTLKTTPSPWAMKGRGRPTLEAHRTVGVTFKVKV